MFRFSKKERKNRIIVAYGSEYGYAEEIAKKMCENLAKTERFTPR